MLFDGKRNKILVKVVAIIAIAAFLGFGLIAGGLAVSGGCGANDPAQVAIDEARAQVSTATAQAQAARTALKANAKNAQARRELAAARADLSSAQSQLASALAALNQSDPQAVKAAEAAVGLAPDDLNAIQSLATIALAQGQTQAPLRALARYTVRHPNDAQAFLLWGQVAEQSGQIPQAILAYQQFVSLAPDDTLAPDVRTHLKDLATQQAKTTTG
jgi:tetratricopeptide (TPR) repeat protein